MRLAMVAIVLGLSLVTAAYAADEYVDVYACMPDCCTFSELCVDIECCGCGMSDGPMTIQFLGSDGAVLGTGTIDDAWCNGCADQHYVKLDNTVNSNDVCKIRFTAAAHDCWMPDWASVKVLCEDPCDCGKWKMAFKGDLYCWMPVE